VAVGGRAGIFHWRAAYSLVDATFRSSFTVSAASNSSADADGNILVSAGDRIPLIPRHTARLMLDWRVGERWDVGANLVAASGCYLHGNENNANQAGGTNAAGARVLGSGWIPGYAVVNLRGSFRLSDHAEVFARLANLFDREYATAGFLTRNSFNADGSFLADPANWTHENAVSPAQPRAIWAGARFVWN